MLLLPLKMLVDKVNLSTQTNFAPIELVIFFDIILYIHLY